MCGRSPAQVSKDQVVPDVDSDQVDRVEGGTVKTVSRHLEMKGEKRNMGSWNNLKMLKT